MRPDFGIPGNCFLALGVGFAGGMAVARRFMRRHLAGNLLTVGCLLASVALLMLALAAPPALPWYQALSLFVAGISAGAVSASVFESIGAVWDADPAGITLRAGIFFSAGSAAASLLMAQCLRADTIGDALGDTSAARLLALAALVPAAAALAFRRIPRAASEPAAAPVNEDAHRQRRSVLALMFGLLLFFQFANEWSIAGWLPVYLVDRLGISPDGAVMLLAIYWMALTAGRTAAAALVKIMPHGRMLWIAAFCALFGGTALTLAATKSGVIVGILAMGAGFSVIYPLASERIAPRLADYHPGYFSGLFTFAMSGGIFAAFVLGHLAEYTGLRVVPLTTMLGSCAVFALILMIRLGRKVSGN